MLKHNTIRVLGIFLFVAVVAIGTIGGCNGDMSNSIEQSGDMIRFTMINNCPDITLWGRGENPPSQGSRGLLNNNQKIEPGGMWMTTLPSNWPAGRIWACPFDTKGKNPWAGKFSNFFSFGCARIEASTVTTANGIIAVNLNPEYIDGIWLPVEITKEGGSCRGLCIATCKEEPTLDVIQADCPTGVSPKFNDKMCNSMNTFCDSDLGAGCPTCKECLTDWFKDEIATCRETYPNCTFGGGESPTAFQIYGCGNSSTWLTSGFGQEVCAALNRGVVGDMNDWINPGTFYPSGVNSNMFSGWIHNGLGCEAYAFPYDDTTAKQGGDMTYNACKDDPSCLEVIVTWCPWDKV